jgi:hypothetical protein
MPELSPPERFSVYFDQIMSDFAGQFARAFNTANQLRNECKLFDCFDRTDPTSDSWAEVSALFSDLMQFKMDPDDFVAELAGSAGWQALPKIVNDPSRFFHLERIAESVDAAVSAATPIAPIDPDVLRLKSAADAVRQTVADVQRGLTVTSVAHAHGLLATLTRRVVLRGTPFDILGPLQTMMDRVRHFSSAYPRYVAFASAFQRLRSLVAAYRYRRYEEDHPLVAQYADMGASWAAAVQRAGGWRGPPAPPLRMGFDRVQYWDSNKRPLTSGPWFAFPIVTISTKPPIFYRVRAFNVPAGSSATPPDFADELKCLRELDYPCLLRYTQDEPPNFTEIRSEYSTKQLWGFSGGVDRPVARTDRLKWIIAMLFGLLYLHQRKVAHGRLADDDGITFDPGVADKHEARRTSGSKEQIKGMASELVLSGFGLHRFTAEGCVTDLSRRESFYQREKADVEAFAQRVEEIARAGGEMTWEARRILEECKGPAEGRPRMKDVRRKFAEIRFRVFKDAVIWAAIETFIGSLPEPCDNWDHLFRPLSEGNDE